MVARNINLLCGSRRSARRIVRRGSDRHPGPGRVRPVRVIFGSIHKVEGEGGSPWNNESVDWAHSRRVRALVHASPGRWRRGTVQAAVRPGDRAGARCLDCTTDADRYYRLSVGGRLAGSDPGGARRDGLATNCQARPGPCKFESTLINPGADRVETSRPKLHDFHRWLRCRTGPESRESARPPRCGVDGVVIPLAHVSADARA